MTVPYRTFSFWIACVICVAVTFILYYHGTSIRNTSYLLHGEKIQGIKNKQDVSIRDLKNTSHDSQYIKIRGIRNNSQVLQGTKIDHFKNKSHVSQGIDIPGMRNIIINQVMEIKSIKEKLHVAQDVDVRRINNVPHVPHDVDVRRIKTIPQVPHDVDVQPMKNIPHVPNDVDVQRMKNIPHVPHDADVQLIKNIPHVPHDVDVQRMKNIPHVPHDVDARGIKDVGRMKNVPYLTQNKDVRHIQYIPPVPQDMDVQSKQNIPPMPQDMDVRIKQNMSHVPAIKDVQRRNILKTHDIKQTMPERKITTSGNKTYLVVWYNIPGWLAALRLDLKACPEVRCQVSLSKSLIDTADAVVVDAVDLHASLKPRGSPNQFWVFFGLESPVHYHTGTYRRSDWRGRFNWTMTYRRDSDIPVFYGQLGNSSDADALNFTAIALNKTRPVTWFVSNCNTPSKREVYVRQLQKYIDVDIYGACGKPTGALKGDFRSPRLSLLNDTYKFYLSFENSLCDDYVTEKLFKTYNAHVIPVVRGGFDYKRYIPKGTYVNSADFPSPKELANYLHYLDNNISAYSEMLTRKHRYRDVGSDIMCSVCRKLQKNAEHKTYSDIHDWLTRSGKACHEPDDL